jgi:phospholipid/cholesterol/gamma-HCH transport system substrate-binding protein
MKNLASLKVGLTVLIGLVIFFFFIFVVGSENNTFSETYKLKMFLENVEGLAKGSMVTLGGLKIGYVDEIDFASQNGKNGINVTISIKREYEKQVTKSSSAVIKTIGLLGDKYIDISIGQPGEHSLAENDYLPVKPSLNLDEMAENVKNALKEFSSTASEMKLVLNDINQGKGTLGKFIQNPEVYDGVNGFVQSMNSIAGAIQSRKGFLGQAIYDPSLYGQITSVTTDLKIVSDSLKYGRGTLGKLIMDDELYNKINTFTYKANNLILKTENTSGTVGSLLNDNDAYIQLRDLLTQLKLLISDIKENPDRYFSIHIF